MDRKNLEIFLGCISLGALIGYCSMIPVISGRLEHWRAQQESYAQKDLLVIDELSRTSQELVTPEVESRIAKGELRWENIAKRGRKNLEADWTVEPGGFERMRMTYAFDSQASEDQAVRTATLIRRFSDDDISNSVGSSLTAMIISAVAGALVATAAVYFRSTRKQELRWLRSIGSVLPSEDYRERKPRIPFVSEPFAESVYAIADAMNLQVEQVRASYENSSRAMTNMPIGILSFDSTLQLEFINPAGRTLLSLGNAQEGKALLDVVRAPIVLDCILETHRTGNPTEVEYERSTEKMWLRLRTHPLALDSSEANKIHGGNVEEQSKSGYPVLLTAIDESRLKQLENLRRDFTANVSHELKTPLAAIKAYAETLLMGAAEDPEACTRFIGRIGEQAGRLDALIRDLLQLTRLQSQPEKPKLQPIRINDVLSASIENHRAVGDQKALSWSLDLTENLMVDSDLESLQMIFNNLLSNAVRYNREHGQIYVSTRREGEWCVVSIRDNGIGIPAADLDRIFERFYRVEKARSQDAGGTGLGLAIVKHLAASIRSTVTVNSQIGVGSEFQTRIPMSGKTDR